jgi:hypothetical protein
LHCLFFDKWLLITLSTFSYIFIFWWFVNLHQRCCKSNCFLIRFALRSMDLEAHQCFEINGFRSPPMLWDQWI